MNRDLSERIRQINEVKGMSQSTPWNAYGFVNVPIDGTPDPFIITGW